MIGGIIGIEDREYKKISNISKDDLLTSVMKEFYVFETKVKLCKSSFEETIQRVEGLISKGEALQQFLVKLAPTPTVNNSGHNETSNPMSLKKTLTILKSLNSPSASEHISKEVLEVPHLRPMFACTSPPSSVEHGGPSWRTGLSEIRTWKQSLRTYWTKAVSGTQDKEEEWIF